MSRLAAGYQQLRRLGPVRVALVVIGVVVVVAAIRPQLLSSQSPDAINALSILKGPSWQHWLGTDEEGSDVLSRIIYGTRLDLLIALGSAGLAAAVGVPAGLVAGYRGKALDYVLRSAAVSTLAFPLILFAMLVVASFGASLPSLVSILGFMFLPQVLLVTRAQTKAIREREYVTAAVVTGATTPRILRRSVLPNVIGPVVVLLPQLMATAILAEAGLSYLGLGVQPPSITWGTILLASKDYYQEQPYYAVSAGLVVMLSAGLLILAGDVISESIDPRRGRRGASRRGRRVLRAVQALPAVAGDAAGAPAQGALAQGAPATVALARGAPAPGAAQLPARLDGPLVAVTDLSVAYAARGPSSAAVATTKAVDAVSFTIARGECLGLVGESGSGKSSIARALVRVVPSQGSFLFNGSDFFALRGEALRHVRREVQMIFQNPQASIDPRRSARQVIAEPLLAHSLVPRSELPERVEQLMLHVGFDPALADRRPHQLSGGQCQRLAIARCLALGAELLICDEPTSALDVSVQAQIVNLLKDLQRLEGASYLFISHDLAVVRQLAHRVAVLYRGRIVEAAPAEQLFASPSHPYTMELLSSVSPVLRGAGAGFPHEPTPAGPAAPAARPAAPAARSLPLAAAGSAGCAFSARCRYADDACRQLAPSPETIEEGHVVECHHWRLLAGTTHYADA